MLVSVVIPSYNHERFLRQAVDSVLSQSHRRIELVVVDDGSRDGSVGLLKQIHDPRLVVHVQENQGAHAAINRGLALAQGDVLAILNSDDVFHPDRISTCVRALDDEGSDLVCTWIEVVDADGTSKGIKQGWKNMRPGWASASGPEAFWSGEDFTLNLLAGNFVSTTSNIVMRRSVYDRVGGMRNLRFAHDWDFMLRAAGEVMCGIVPRPLMQYRLHGSNTITSNRAWMLFEACWVLAANFHRFEGRRLYAQDDVQDQIAMVRAIAASVRVGGCDRLLWMLRQYLDARRAAGDPAPDEALLEDAVLRQAFIELVDA
ncbi:glycosyltransferase [Luteimonas sp. XNQY3]|nr:glycosyltransferase [Luteimonas sp. XNQY3]MCD9005778.1 glycosyltransferase [Luteimonas sp. XNQY3]